MGKTSRNMLLGLSMEYSFIIFFVISIWNKKKICRFFSKNVLESPIPPVSSKQQQRSGKVLTLVPRGVWFNSHCLLLFFYRFLIIKSKMNFPDNLWKNNYKTPTAKTYGEYLQKYASWNIIILYHFRFICDVSLQFVFVISIWNKSFFAVFFLFFCVRIANSTSVIKATAAQW